MKRLLDSDDPLSIKRFVVLVVSAHFIIASFAVLFIAFYLVFYVPKGKVDINLLQLLKDVLYYDIMIIGGGLGLIGVENFGQAMVEKARAIGSKLISPTVKVDNVENINVDNPDKP
jgi:hypothetical protein